LGEPPDPRPLPTHYPDDLCNELAKTGHATVH
jgi:hypothetical protein